MFYSSNPNMSHHLITYLRMQSCDLQLCFMLALFRDKKCCNCFNFVPCIFVGFYCIGFGIRLVKNRAWIEEQLDFTKSSWEANPRKSHASLEDFASISWVRHSCEIPAKLSTLRIFKCDFLTLHPYYIYPYYPQKC